MELKEEIIRLVPEEMTLGFALYDLKTGKTILINENEEFPLASLAKFISAVIAVERGLKVQEEAIYKAIAEHSSHAYKEILLELSDEEMNTELKSRGLQIHIHADNKNKQENCGTPSAIMKFLKMTRNHDMEVVIKALKDQNDPDGFRFQRFSEGKWLHMTGGLDGVCNDIGFWKLPDRMMICVGLMKSCIDSVEWTSLEKKMKEIGEVITNAYGNLESVD